MMQDRIAPRRRMLKAGKIEFGGGAIDCTLRNLSDTGAALDVVTPVGIPERFMLVVASELSKPSRVVWRTEKRIGVTFE